MKPSNSLIEIDSDGECTKKRPRRSRRQVKKLLGRSRKTSSIYDPPYRISKRLGSSKRDMSNEQRLDSNIFQSYLEDLWKQISEDKRSSYAYLDSLWFYMYSYGVDKTKVLQWIKRKKIFSRQYVFVPIICWSHWSLLILCHFGETDSSTSRRPCMLLLDSLQTMEPKRLEAGIRRLIVDIYKSEGREENKYFINKIPLLVPNVPQQTNGEECGMFVLYFIYCFLQRAPENLAKEGEDCTQQGELSFLDERWFNLEELESFRKEVQTYQMSKNIESMVPGK